MRILIADDDPVARRVLQATLTECGYEVVLACDGTEAWHALPCEDAPPLAILDWMMRGMEGVEVCRKVRQAPNPTPTYIILLTAKSHKKEIVAGLRAGADDYVTKSFDREEFLARVQVGVRVVELQRRLAERVTELEDALSRVKQLQELLPICCYCKKIRDDRNYWQQVESYISEHSGARFSHGICPDCYENVAKPKIQKLKQQGQATP